MSIYDYNMEKKQWDYYYEQTYVCEYFCGKRKR